mgnify:CR=1 FL=1
MDLKLQGRKALITGASKGIGEAITRTLAAEGCNVTLAARSKEPMHDLATELAKTYNIKSDVIPIDLSEMGSAEKLAQKCPDIDILINNSGAIPSGRLDEIDECTWRATWDLKVFGYINLSRLMYAKMKKQNHGVILNIIGSAGQKPNYNYIAGSTSNAGLMHFTKSLAAGSCNDGIRVLAINPGLTASDRMITMMRSQAEKKLGDPNRWEELLKDLPFERAAKSEEVADLTTFLVSPRCSYISGTVITIDGGHSNQ